MLDLIISVIFDDAVSRVWAKLTSSRPRPARSRRGPSELQARSLRADYRLWAKRHGMTTLEGGHRYRGRLGRHSVTLSVETAPGTPRPIVLDMELAHALAPRVLRAGAEAHTEVERGLVALCRAGERATHLQSIAIVTSGLRFELAPLTPPEVVESSARDAAAVVELARATTNAYR